MAATCALGVEAVDRAALEGGDRVFDEATLVQGVAVETLAYEEVARVWRIEYGSCLKRKKDAYMDRKNTAQAHFGLRLLACGLQPVKRPRISMVRSTAARLRRVLECRARQFLRARSIKASITSSTKDL